MIDLLHEILERKRKAIQSGQKKSGWDMDILDRLLEKDEDGRDKFDAKEIMDETFTFYAAG